MKHIGDYTILNIYKCNINIYCIILFVYIKYPKLNFILCDTVFILYVQYKAELRKYIDF